MIKNLKNIHKKKVIFLLPTLNEEKALERTIKEIPVNTIKEKGYECEIAIVDGNSTDKTILIAKKNNVHVIISPKRGYGFQYKYALSRLNGDIIITGDADGTYPLEMSHKLIELLENENLDFISTNRFFDLKKGSMSFMHYLGNKVLTLTGNILFNLRLEDNQSGMWCFNLNKVKNLRLINDDMAFSEEIKIKAFKKLKCKEIGIYYKPRIGKSKLNYLHAIKNTIFLFKLKFRI